MMRWHKLRGVDRHGKCRMYATGNWRLERRTMHTGHIKWVLGLYRTDSRGFYTLHTRGWFRRMRDAKARAEATVAWARDILEGQQ